MKSVVRAGYKMGSAVQTAIAEIKEEMSDLNAEAKADLEKKSNGSNQHASS